MTAIVVDVLLALYLGFLAVLFVRDTLNGTLA